MRCKGPGGITVSNQARVGAPLVSSFEVSRDCPQGEITIVGNRPSSFLWAGGAPTARKFGTHIPNSDPPFPAIYAEIDSGSQIRDEIIMKNDNKYEIYLALPFLL